MLGLFLAFFTFLSLSFLLPSVLFIINLDAQKAFGYYFFIALISSILVLYKSLERSKFFKFLILFVLLLGFSMLLGYFSLDYSYDGRGYRTQIIYALNHGWNPIYQVMNEVFPSPMNIWGQHYTKAAELISSTISLGFIEAGKARNLIAIFAGLFYGIYLFRQVGLSRLRAFLVAFLLSFNAIALLQAMTYYVDGFITSMMLILLLAIFHLHLNIKKSNLLIYVVLILSITILVSTKISSAPFILSCFIGITIFNIFKKQRSIIFNCIKVGFISLALFAITNINPLFTNIFAGKDILYPLVGKDKIDVISMYVQDDLKEDNYLLRQLKSLYSITNHTKVELKIPFIYAKNKGEQKAWYDTRIAGWGIFFSGIFSLGLIGLIYLFISSFLSSKQKLTLALVILTIYIPSIITPMSFWARYNGFIYFIPFIVLFSLFYIKQNSFFCSKSLSLQGFLSSFIVASSIIQILVFIASSYRQAFLYNSSVKSFLEEIKASSKVFILYPSNEDSFIAKLDAYKIPYKLVDRSFFLENKKDFKSLPYGLEDASYTLRKD